MKVAVPVREGTQQQVDLPAGHSLQGLDHRVLVEAHQHLGMVKAGQSFSSLCPVLGCGGLAAIGVLPRPELDLGQIGVRQVGEACLLKQVRRHPGGRVMVCCVEFILLILRYDCFAREGI